jgi:hypothetical protein
VQVVDVRKSVTLDKKTRSEDINRDGIWSNGAELKSRVVASFDRKRLGPTLSVGSNLAARDTLDTTPTTFFQAVLFVSGTNSITFPRCLGGSHFPLFRNVLGT